MLAARHLEPVPTNPGRGLLSGAVGGCQWHMQHMSASRNFQDRGNLQALVLSCAALVADPVKPASEMLVDLQDTSHITHRGRTKRSAKDSPVLFIP